MTIDIQIINICLLNIGRHYFCGIFPVCFETNEQQSKTPQLFILAKRKIKSWVAAMTPWTAFNKSNKSD